LPGELALKLTAISEKPLAFWINSALVAAYAFLLWPIFDPVFFNVKYAVYLLVVTLPAMTYAYLALVGSKRINTGLLIVAVLGFTIAEAALRLREPGQRPESIFADGQHPYYMFAGAPGSSGKNVPQQGGANDAENTYTLDRFGFRIERPLKKSKPADELRIFVLGGSTVVLGAPLAKTIPGQIESALRRRGFSQATVYNFGIVSAVSGQELALLTHMLVDYSPDIVIAYGFGNDVLSPYRYDPRPGFPLNFVRLQVGAHALDGQMDLRTAIASQLFKSRVVTSVFGVRSHEVRLPMSTLRAAVGYRTPEWEAAIVQAYSDNMYRMCRLSQAFNFNFYEIMQPMIFQKSPLSEVEAKITYGDEAHAAYVRREYQRGTEAVTQLQTRDGVTGASCRFIDLTQIFANDKRTLFWDLIHLNNEGNATVGAAIAAELAADLQTRPRAPADAANRS
jgi:hypothetical protein